MRKRETAAGWHLRPLLAALAIAFALPASAQESASAFYPGKTVRLIVGYPPGTVYDTYTRMMARHYTKHLPGKPTGIVQNMPGAGGLNAIVYATNVAAADGLQMAISAPQNSTDLLLDPSNAKYDPRRVAWIGSVSSETGACVFWHGKGKTIGDLRAREHVLGTTGGPTAGTSLEGKALEALLGLKFKYISGYRSTVDIRLAADKNEVDGVCGLATSTILRDMDALLKNGTIAVPIQTGLISNPGFAKVPTVLDLVKTQEERQILTLIFGPAAYFRPFVTSGATPPDRVAALRAAFDATMKDPEFLDDMQKAQLDVRPLTGAQVAAQVEEIYKTPPHVVERTRKILGFVP